MFLQSSDIGQNSDGGISDFRISGQSFIKENCHSSWVSDDIDMKLGPVNKLDKRNKTGSKKTCRWPHVSNYGVIIIFPIYCQFGAIRKPDSGLIVCKTNIFIKSKFLSYRKWKTNLKSLYHRSHTIALSKGTILAKRY